MPVHDYDCSNCGHSFELRKGWHDVLDANCERCGAPATRRFASPTVIYKGGGFYTTDYANNKGRANSDRQADTSDSAKKSSSESDKSKKPTETTKNNAPASNSAPAQKSPKQTSK